MWRPFHKTPSPCANSSVKRKRENQGDWLSQGNGIDEDDCEYDDTQEYMAMYGLLSDPVRVVEGAEYVESSGLRLGHASIQGYRPANEDAHLIHSLAGNIVVAALFDGHAGREAGIYASENLVRILKLSESWKEYSASKRSSQSSDIELLKSALIEAFEMLDSSLRSSDQVKYGGDLSGCTAVCCLITPTHILCASVGDSR